MISFSIRFSFHLTSCVNEWLGLLDFVSILREWVIRVIWFRFQFTPWLDDLWAPIYFGMIWLSSYSLVCQSVYYWFHVQVLMIPRFLLSFVLSPFISVSVGTGSIISFWFYVFGLAHKLGLIIAIMVWFRLIRFVNVFSRLHRFQWIFSSQGFFF